VKPRRPAASRPLRRWLGANALRIYGVLAFGYLFAPIAYVTVFSFNDSRRTNLVWNGFTTSNWTDPCREPGLCESVRNSLTVGVLATVIATVLGTLAAFALTRHRFRGRTLINLLIFLPMATPEVVMAASLLTLFLNLSSVFTLGMTTIVIAHVMFCISFVIVAVKARIQTLDPQLEQAAMDLYASEVQTFLRVTLPLVTPGIAGAALLAFSLSFDDYIITSFTSSTVDTFPKFVYASALRGSPAEAYVVGVAMFYLALLIILFGDIARRRMPIRT
jgi:spermidine/putrescine transport system permease protein